jgi:3-hydroxypropanoate dehydrogenase
LNGKIINKGFYMRTIDSVFDDRTCSKFLDKPVSKETLVKIYDFMKLGPTSGNACPLRIFFAQSNIEKEKLCKTSAENNVAKIKSAPVTALFAYDMKFYEKMDKLYPTGKALQNLLANASEYVQEREALRNSSIQASYFMMIARGMGLSCGPMSGFDSVALNEAFFKNTNYRINFICNLGYRNGDNLYPRLPRLNFDEVCKIL